MSFDFLGNFSFWGGGFTGSLLPFLFVLTVVVFFHELGHFLVARWCGVRVLVFSVGFGPELFGFNDRHGTRWKLSAIPLGGYVKFFGDENAASVPDPAATATMTESEKRESFHHQRRAEPCRDRRGRPDRQFHSGDRDLHRRVHVLRQAIDHGAGRLDPAGQRRSGRGLPAGRRRRRHQWTQDREFFRHAADRRRQCRPGACRSPSSARAAASR